MRCPALGMTSDGRTLAYGRSLGLAGVDETADHP